MNKTPLPASKLPVEGLHPIASDLNALVQSLRAPLPKVAPRKLEPAK